MKIKILTEKEFFPIFEKLKDKVFGDTLYYHTRDVRTSHESLQFPKLKKRLENNFTLYLVAYDAQGKVMGWSMSGQLKIDELMMWNSAVLPKFRRKGIYSKLMQKVIEISAEEGFQTITSFHMLSNNDIIIAKLKQGFVINGFQASDTHGSLVQLVYHINQDRKRMFQFRCGMKRPDKKIKKLLRI